MILTGRQFSEIVNSLKTTSQREDERRASIRIGVRARVNAYRLDLMRGRTQHSMLLVRDISRGGIGFISREPELLGTRMVIVLDGGPTTQMPILGQVVRRQPIAGYSFIYGLAFIRVLDLDEYQLILAQDHQTISELASSPWVREVPAAPQSQRGRQSPPSPPDVVVPKPTAEGDASKAA